MIRLSYTSGVPTLQVADNVRLYFKDWGNGAPAVFLHAYYLNADARYYQMAFLASHGLRCIAYDRRGHGRSDHPGYGYDYDTLADDLAAVILHLDLRGVMPVGHLMGTGEIARYFSKHGSSKIERAVLVSPITPFMLRTSDNPNGLDPAILEHLVGMIEADYPNAFRQFAVSFWGDGGQVSTAMKEWVYQLGLQTSLIAASACIRANWLTDFRADLAAFDIPTLVIQGDQDLVLPLPQSGQPTADLIPQSRLLIYEGTGHSLPLVERGRLSRNLLHFATS